MEELFHTKFKYNFLEYKKMMYVITTKKLYDKNYYLKINLVLLLLVFISFLLNLETWITSSVSTIAFVVIFSSLTFDKSLKEGYDTHILINEVTIDYAFYNDYMEIFTEQIQEKIFYEQLHKVIETDTNYYILISANSGYNFIKKDIKKERTFNKFIKSKVPNYLDLNKKKSS